MRGPSGIGRVATGAVARCLQPPTDGSRMFRKGFLAAAALAALLAPSSAHALTFTSTARSMPMPKARRGTGSVGPTPLASARCARRSRRLLRDQQADEVVLGPQEYLLTEDALLLIDEDSVQGMTIRGAGARATTSPGGRPHRRHRQRGDRRGDDPGPAHHRRHGSQRPGRLHQRRGRDAATRGGDRQPGPQQRELVRVAAFWSSAARSTSSTRSWPTTASWPRAARRWAAASTDSRTRSSMPPTARSPPTVRTAPTYAGFPSEAASMHDGLAHERHPGGQR